MSHILSLSSSELHQELPVYCHSVLESTYLEFPPAVRGNCHRGTNEQLPVLAGLNLLN